MASRSGIPGFLCSAVFENNSQIFELGLELGISFILSVLVTMIYRCRVTRFTRVYTIGIMLFQLLLIDIFRAML